MMQEQEYAEQGYDPLPEWRAAAQDLWKQVKSKYSPARAEQVMVRVLLDTNNSYYHRIANAMQEGDISILEEVSQ